VAGIASDYTKLNCVTTLSREDAASDDGYATYISLSFPGKNKIYIYRYVLGPTPQNPKFFKFGAFARFWGPLHPISPLWGLGPLPNIPLPKTKQTYTSVSTSFFDAFFTASTKGLTTQYKGHVSP
jgi:hypothetical protein